MIHIVFQNNDAQVLQEAIKLDSSLDGDLIVIEDDYAVGPVFNIFEPEGMEARRQWWREVLAGGDYEGSVDAPGHPEDEKLVHSLKQRLDENAEEKLWIWAAQNKHDVSGYYWLMSQLKDYQGRIFILYLNNLPFINEKGHIFYPSNLFEIPAKEFLKAKKLARPITLSEFEVDPDEWQKLCNEKKLVRILEGGKKLTQYNEDFYDEELKKFIGTEWQKTSKLIHQFLAKAKHTTGDAYLLWRVKQLLNSGVILAQGEVKNMKDFEIRSNVAQPAADTVST